MDQLSRLIINGMEIERFKEISGLGLDPDVICYDLPQHTVIDKVNADKWIGDITEEDAEILSQVLTIDTDKFIGKRCRIFVQSLGPIPRGR